MTTPPAEIDRAIQDTIERQQQVLIRQMCYCAEKITNYARTPSGRAYKDQTGNLRSSTGCIVAVDGQVVYSSSFQAVKAGADGSEGKKFAESLVSKYPKGIALIAVAGMNYAVHVQNRGFNVLQGAELYAEKIVKDMLKQLELLK